MVFPIHMQVYALQKYVLKRQLFGKDRRVRWRSEHHHRVEAHTPGTNKHSEAFIDGSSLLCLHPFSY